MSTRKKYTPTEHSALLAFVKANKHRSPVRGNKLWRLAEAQGVTSHSWQSMKARYELLSGEAKRKGKKRAEKKKREAEAQKRLSFSHSTSSSTSTSTSTSASLVMPTPSTSTLMSPHPPTRLPPPPRRAKPQTMDNSTQTDGTGMVSVGVGIHLFCPVSHYRWMSLQGSCHYRDVILCHYRWMPPPKHGAPPIDDHNPYKHKQHNTMEHNMT